MKKAIISLSGGLDSTCLLMYLLSNDYEVKAYSFDYGQKHKIELKKVKKNIKFLQSKGLPVTHQIINLKDVFSDSASTLHQGGEAIPHGHYADENMKSTVVENRNIIFSAIIYGKALSWANKTQDDVVITQGIHNGDHCFTRDTKILTTNGLKTVDELKVGDKVYSFNEETLRTEIDECVDIIKKGTNNIIYNIQTTSGKIRLTSEHKVYVVEYGDMTNSGFEKKISHKLVKDLKVGDIMITPNKLPDNIYSDDIKDELMRFGDAAMTKVTNIEIEDKLEEVFDISIKNNHNFFAGDLGNVLISNSIYPDCTEESRAAAEHLYKISNWGSERVDFIAPFVNIDKSEVLKEGLDAMKKLEFSKSDIKKVLKNTHTCYDPDEKERSCGKCGACTERLEAFESVCMKDPIPYQE